MTDRHPDRPAWFTGSDDSLALLRRAAGAVGVPLDPDTPPGEEDAQQLTDELGDILLTEHCFDADRDWEITPFGDLVETLIDTLNRYAYPD
ncbi:MULTISPECIES: hypothetical protein [unclassified Kitasatospora]|uniref:hypothetical protein n=1 Tax=unclassified Kitasatospora TaxID=2633591 RepID=UPI0033FC488F